jgi:predicted dehydrogenase
MKIGFVDYFLDEWHANNFPEWLTEASGGEIEIAYAYAMIDHPKGGMTTDEWCAKFNARRIDTIEELVKKSDAIVVLSPDNPEHHEELCKIPLQSGKPVYVDKTFAETKEIAERIFAGAINSGTPCYSASGLRFAQEYIDIEKGTVQNIISYGAGRIETYSFHQVEPIIYLMGKNIEKVMFTGTEKHQSYVCEFTDGRRAVVSHHGHGCPFGMVMDFADGSSKVVNAVSAYFKNFAADMVRFFKTGEASISPEETITGIAVIEAALKAEKNPGNWVAV